MKRILVAAFQVCAIHSCLAQAPSDWKRVSETKEISGEAFTTHQVGVWKSQNAQVTVQVLQGQPIKNAGDVWRIVGGTVYELTGSNQEPTSWTIALETPHVCFRLTGKGNQDNGAIGALDTYLVFAESSTYKVKVFSAATASVFSIAEWDFGQPLQTDREDFTHALRQAKETLDKGKEFESAKNATDEELRADLSVWTSVVDQYKVGAKNTSKKYGRAFDIDAELRPGLRRLANNKFFNIDHEEALHPGYRHELRQIAAMRGQNISEPSPPEQLGYALGRYGVSLAVLAFIISRWTRRVSRKTSITAGMSRAKFYGLMLLKMSWRVAIIVVLSLVVVLLAHTASPAISQEEASKAISITIALFLVFLPPTVLLTSWTHTKRKFSIPPPTIGTNEEDGKRRSDHDPTPPSAIVAKPLDGISALGVLGGAEIAKLPADESNDKDPTETTRSTWWKRLFTVLEIAVFLVSAVVAILVLRELPLLALAAVLLLPVFVIHLFRIAIIYIVEGRKPFEGF